MATDTGIVTIYDLENDGKPLTCHKIDAREFLRHPRWSATPPEEEEAPEKAKGDSGEAMRLKELSFNALRAIAHKAGIADFQTMKKAELVIALTPAEK